MVSSRAFSLSRQESTPAAPAASTKAPWISAHFHGLAAASAWL